MSLQLNGQDKQYLSLLAHLRKPSSTLPIQTLTSALPYYLSQLEVNHVTQLTGTILGSAFWTPISIPVTSTLSTIFRNAVHLRKKHLEDVKSKTWLSRSVKSQLRSWTNAIMNGNSTGDSFLRCSIHGDVVAVLSEAKVADFDYISLSPSVADELILALASVMQQACGSSVPE